jgi:D-3-phosphoglycerate dehydrogenase
MNVAAYDPLASDQRFKHAGVDRAASLEELFAQSDVISLHVPLLPETRRLIGAEELAACKPDAVLINVSRGGVVDETALYAALRDGRIAGAAIDVFDPEPPARDNPLFSLPNVITTPHIAGLTAEGMAKLSLAIAVNLLAALRGERPPHLVHPDSWPPRRLAGREWPLAASAASS